MPSPFPGMDPFLEHTGLWPGFHQGFVAAARALLNTLLPAGYVADIGERRFVVQPPSSIYPDLVLSQTRPAGEPRGDTPQGATATAGEPPWVLTIEPVEVREPYVEILSLIEPERVVTVMEVLSPANKAPGGEGQRQYRQKQEALLASRASLIEIDLLRGGAHTVLAPREDLLQRGDWNYLVCLHRPAERWRLRVWPATLRERLPRIAVPLSPPDPEIELDLQAVLDRCYDEGAYHRRIDYRREPPGPAFAAEDTEWPDALLKSRGLRG
jgi:hypothetical protein